MNLQVFFFLMKHPDRLPEEKSRILTCILNEVNTRATEPNHLSRGASDTSSVGRDFADKGSALDGQNPKK